RSHRRQNKPPSCDGMHDSAVAPPSRNNSTAGASMITRLARRTRLRSATASATKPPKEWPTRWTLPLLALRMTHSSASASWEIEESCAVRRSAVLPYPSRLVVTQRSRLSHAEIKGRHAAPVLHD